MILGIPLKSYPVNLMVKFDPIYINCEKLMYSQKTLKGNNDL